MCLSTKIKISFVLIMLFPTMMMCMFALAIGKSQIEAIEKNYNIEVEEEGSIFNRVDLLGSIMEAIQKDVLYIIDNEADEKNIIDEFSEMAEKLNSEVASIIVFDEDKCVFNGFGDSQIEKLLPIQGTSGDGDSQSIYIEEGDKILVDTVRYELENGSGGTVYVVGMMNYMLPEVRNLMVQFIVVCFILIILAGMCLSIWLYKSVVKPIYGLQRASENITNGNLDFSITPVSNDEFGKLYESFEEMRVHLKASIEENLQHDKESKELISNISHDLKTPITAIKGYAEGIMEGVADTPEKVDRYIKTIYNKANDMDRLIGELTVYSRIDTNKIPYHFIELNVCDYFEDCMEEISTELENKGFKYTYLNYTDKNTKVIADPEQMKRVINNLVSNSIKYNDKKTGCINIRIKDQRDYIHFEFEDNGRGVAPEELPYIFERFYRTDTSRNTLKGGSGIGLSIVKKIIEAHGGTIWAYSTVNTGLSIHFLLKKVEENRQDTDSELTEQLEVNKTRAERRKEKKEQKEQRKNGRKENINS